MRAGDQVFFAGQVGEHAPAFEHLHDAFADNIVAHHAVDAFARQFDGAVGNLATFGAQDA